MKKLLLLTLALLMVAGCSAPTLKVGLGIVPKMTGTAATADGDGKAQADVTACAATFDANGKVVGIQIDVAQCAAPVTAAGAVTAPSEIQTKKEKKEGYNMKGASGIGKEWYEQIAAFEAYCVGKTAADISAMPVKTEGEHTNVPDVEELKSSCTMSCGDFIEALSKANANAA